MVRASWGKTSPWRRRRPDGEMELVAPIENLSVNEGHRRTSPSGCSACRRHVSFARPRIPSQGAPPESGARTTVIERFGNAVLASNRAEARWHSEISCSLQEFFL